MDIMLKRILSLIPDRHGADAAFARSIGYKSGNVIADWRAGRSAPLSPFLRRLPPSKTHDYEFSLLTSQAKYPMIQLSVFCKIAYIKATFPLCPF